MNFAHFRAVLRRLLADEGASVMAEYAIVLSGVSITSAIAFNVFQNAASTIIQTDATTFTTVNLNSYVAGQ